MTDCLARAIAARTKSRFVDTNADRPQTLEGMRKLARATAASSKAQGRKPWEVA
jgi:hypothetical protein